MAARVAAQAVAQVVGTVRPGARAATRMAAAPPDGGGNTSPAALAAARLARAAVASVVARSARAAVALAAAAVGLARGAPQAALRKTGSLVAAHSPLEGQPQQQCLQQRPQRPQQRPQRLRAQRLATPSETAAPVVLQHAVGWHRPRVAARRAMRSSALGRRAVSHHPPPYHGGMQRRARSKTRAPSPTAVQSFVRWPGCLSGGCGGRRPGCAVGARVGRLGEMVDTVHVPGMRTILAAHRVACKGFSNDG